MTISKFPHSEVKKLRIIYINYFIAIILLAIIHILTNKGIYWELLVALLPFILATSIVYYILYRYGSKTVILIIVPILSILIGGVMIFYGNYVNDHGGNGIGDAIIYSLSKLVSIYCFVFGSITLLPVIIFNGKISGK